MSDVDKFAEFPGEMVNGQEPAAAKMGWEQAVAWARETPEMSLLVRLCYYDDPIEAAAQRFEASEEWDAIVDLLQPRADDRVLEIGAGRGIVSWSFAGLGCDVHALEPDASTLIGAGAIDELCRRTGRRISVHKAAGERLGFDDDYFDIVICRAVLHHVTDLRGVCREAFRVLKPGGRFLAIKEHVAETEAELAAFLKSHPLHHLYGGEHAYPLATYHRSLSAAGFAKLRDFGHYAHAVTSAPALTSDALRAMAKGALAARVGGPIADVLVRHDSIVRAYRRWLTWRCRIPGRLHSFLAVKPT